MSTEMRLTGSMIQKMKEDLCRPHSFAWERVGFLFCKAALDGKLLLASFYQVLPDEMYIHDPYVGACFSGTAIRSARQRGLETGESIFHVHSHEGEGPPRFSKTDLECLYEMVPTMVSVAPKVPHGALLLNDDSAYGLLWKMNCQPKEIDSIRLMGFRSVKLNGG